MHKKMIKNPSRKKMADTGPWATDLQFDRAPLLFPKANISNQEVYENAQLDIGTDTNATAIPDGVNLSSSLFLVVFRTGCV